MQLTQQEREQVRRYAQGSLSAAIVAVRAVYDARRMRTGLDPHVSQAEIKRTARAAIDRAKGGK